jgi:hypothetical protein
MLYFGHLPLNAAVATIRTFIALNINIEMFVPFFFSVCFLSIHIGKIPFSLLEYENRDGINISLK